MNNFLNLPKALKNYATTELFTADIDGKSYPLQDMLYGAIQAVKVVNFTSECYADEALSKATIKVFERCKEYNPSLSSLKTFGSKLGYYAALHVLEDELRHSLRNVSLDTLYEDEDGNVDLALRRLEARAGIALSAEDEYIRKEDYERLERHIEALSPKSKQVIRFTEVGFRGESLGEALGCNANSASVRANRAKKELRIAIEANKAA